MGEDGWVDWELIVTLMYISVTAGRGEAAFCAV